MIDDCSTLKPSIAIQEVVSNPSTKFFYKGDQVSHAISCADILCKYIDRISLNRNVWLNSQMIERLGLPSSIFRTTCISRQWLPNIKPSRRVEIVIDHKRPHPMFIFFNEEKGAFGGTTKEAIEKSSVFNKALNHASKKGGTVKFFEPNDQNYLGNEDCLVEFNVSSTRKIDDLIGLGCKSRRINKDFFENPI